MKAIRKISLILLVCFISLCLSSCWDFQEVSNRGFIFAIGIDFIEDTNEIQVTVQYLVPEKLSTAQKTVLGGGSEGNTVSTRGKTIIEAMEKLNKKMSLTPYYQVNKLILIGEEMARHGLQNITDYLFRYFQNRSIARVILAHGKAADYLYWETPVSKTSSSYISTIEENYADLASKREINMLKIMKIFSSETKCIYLPSINFEKNNKGKKELVYSNIGVFRKYKLIDFLNEKESRGLLFVDNNLKNTVIETNLPGEGDDRVALHIVRCNTRIIPKIVDGKISMHIELNADGDIEALEDKYKLFSQENLKNVEKRFNEEIKSDMEACMKKVQQELNLDVFGFGELIYRKYPSEWKESIKNNWEEVYPNVEISYKITSRILGTNLIVDPVTQGKEGY